MQKRWIAGLVISVVLVVGGLWSIYSYADPEKLELNDTVRESTPGNFVLLSHGYTHYEIGGPENGPIVVLAAGFSVPYYIWDPTYKALTDAGFRVLRYDYYGRGYSDRPVTDYKVDLHITQLNELLEKIHIAGPIDLVGLSFGGSVITTFAYRYPERVRKLVYMDPGFRYPSATPSFSGLPSVWGFFTAIFDERYWPQQQMGDFLHPDRFPDWPSRYSVQMRYKGFRRSRLAEFVSNAGEDQGDEIARVGEHPRPVLVIWGKQDKTVLFSNSEWLMKLLPNGRLLAVEEAGHLPQWEQPNVVHPELIAFLSQ